MSLTIRPFEETDYAAYCDLGNTIEPDYPRSVEDRRFADETRDPRCRWGRGMAEWTGAGVVGYADYWQESELYHPRKFWLGLDVHPDFRRRGIGAALYDTLERGIAPHDPILAHTHVREDRPPSLRFLEVRGFREAMREWESRLDVAAFDPAPYAGCEERLLREHGIAIRSLPELNQDPGWERKLWESEFDVGRDVPATDEPTMVPFQHFRENRLANPNLVPEGWLIAVHDGEYVGMTNLWSSPDPGVFYTGLTGVRRTYRRRGIALALKLRAIDYARRNRIREIRTWNASTNEGMLGINIRLGFVRQPAWIDFVKEYPGAR